MSKLPDIGQVEGVVALAAVAVVGFIAWKTWRGAGKVVEAVQNGAINPASSNNVVNRGVTAVGEAVTGQKGWTLGGSLFELFNPGAVAAENAALGKSGSPTAGSTLRYQQGGNGSGGGGAVASDSWDPWADTVFGRGSGYSSAGTFAQGSQASAPYVGTPGFAGGTPTADGMYFGGGGL